MASGRYKIGIIGYGDFTRVLCEYLAPYADIVVSSREQQAGSAVFGARFGTVNEVLSQPIIIPSIPAQFFREFFTKHAALVNPDALVIDVASVKVVPLQLLHELLPSTCRIIGTHPMFGPASIVKNNGITGLKCAVCPVRIDDESFARFTQFLSDELKLRIFHKTPEEHDREMAYVQGLSHYIGRVMDEMDIPLSELSTLAYDDLIDMKRIQGGDSWDLFRSIMHENPYALEVNQAFDAACQRVNRRLQ